MKIDGLFHGNSKTFSLLTCSVHERIKVLFLTKLLYDEKFFFLVSPFDALSEKVHTIPPQKKLLRIGWW